MTTHKLYLSSDKPWDALYTAEEGHTLYKTESPSPWKMAQYVKILRAIPSLVSEKDNADLKDSFGVLAEIEYHKFHATKIRYGGEEKSVNDFFTKKGFNVFGRNHIFTGPNGMEYMWKMESDTCKLFANDSNDKAPVAVFHQKHGGLIRQARPAYLEIYAEGRHMVDLIIVTFVYMERLRKELETTAIAAASGQ